MPSLLCVQRWLKTCLSPSSTPAFQVLSDLHLEVGQQYEQYHFPVAAPYLILAGDIGRLVDYDGYRAFLRLQTSRFERVFLILGNHEFYGSTYTATLDAAVKLEREPDLQSKLVLLNRKRFDISGTNVTILGCSLWSQVPEDAALMVRMKVNDFSRIDGWTTDAHNAQHNEDTAWLREQMRTIQVEAKRKVLVVTHHAPCVIGTSEPRFDNSPWASAFATDLLNGKAEWVGVTTWIYGHTHYSTQFTKAGIRVVSNQRGYVLPNVERKDPAGYGKGKWRRFDETFVLRV